MLEKYNGMIGEEGKTVKIDESMLVKENTTGGEFQVKDNFGSQEVFAVKCKEIFVYISFSMLIFDWF